MNIARAFVKYMEEDLLLGTFGEDIFIGSAPLDGPDPCWWVVSSGGASSIKAQTGEKMKNYTLNIYYRNIDAEDVYDQLQQLEIALNSGNCDQLDSFDTIEMEAILFPSDQDIDVDDRTIGIIEARITVYSS